MFELLIFDLDGTLIDSRGDIATAVNMTLEELGLPKRKPEDIYGYIGGGVHNLVLRSLTEEYAGLLEKGVDLFWANYKEHVLDTTDLYPGAAAMLEGFFPRKMAVVTNKPFNHTQLILRGLGIDRYFVSVQGWKVGLDLKPEPGLILAAVREAGVRPGDAVMIGDGMPDVLAAKAAGVKSCAVAYGYGDRERLKEAGPDFFAEDVHDIIRIFN